LARNKPWGRFASLSASTADAATAFAIYDRHMVGDRAPYVFVTHDYGAHWASIASTLPPDVPVRSVLEDPRRPSLAYVGTDLGIFASWSGSAWQKVGTDLPPAAVRGIALQPDTDDLVIGTHGRGVYVLDDAAPLQQLATARRARFTLFPVRTSYLWQTHDTYGTRIDGEAPPDGAIVSFYQSAPSATNPTAEVLDARGRIVRRFTSHVDHGKKVPDLTDQVGINRFVWDLAVTPPVRWNAAPLWNNYYDDGAQVVPGRYVVRVFAGSRTYDAPVVVKSDPRVHYTPAQYADRYEAVQALFADYGRLDTQLNVLSTIVAEGPHRIDALDAAGNHALSARVAATLARTGALIALMSSNPANDQDNDFLVDRLRERLQTHIDGFGASLAPPTAEQRREAAVLHALAERLTHSYATLMDGDVRSTDVGLQAAHLAPLTQKTQAASPERGADQVGGDRR
jgi:hypothetical protein